ncbi:MAG: HIT domain-containing protein [Planctomycetota bacterium]
MSVQDCIFCKIIAGQIPCTKIYENEFVLAFLDVGPVSEGHVLVVSKQHTSSVDQTDPRAMAEIAKVLPDLAGSVKKAMAADGYNVLCNNGASAGQVVGHMILSPGKQTMACLTNGRLFSIPRGRPKRLAIKFAKI